MINVFVSRPTWIPENMNSGIKGFERVLDRDGFQRRTLGTTDYGTDNPLTEVVEMMGECQGAVILGIPQIWVSGGRVKDELVDQEIMLPTEWNHIEAALAFSHDLPILFIHHEGVGRGVFDRGATGRYVHGVDMTDPGWPTSAEIQGVLPGWESDVRAFQPNDTTENSSSPSPPSDTGITDEALAILALLGKSDGGHETTTKIATLIGKSEVATEYYVDLLKDRDLVGMTYVIGGPNGVYLTKFGRALLAKLDLL